MHDAADNDIRCKFPEWTQRACVEPKQIFGGLRVPTFLETNQTEQ